MATFSLSRNFDYFFGQLNPSPSFEQQAASQYGTAKGLIENPRGLAAALSPQCFLQGSYRQETAIYAINDVDIVVLCELWQPSSGGGAGRSWSRDDIFHRIAAPLLAEWRYRDKVHYKSDSMCIKVDLSIKLEILPVVYRAGNDDPNDEPFRLWRPEHQQWEDGYARKHQRLLSAKNVASRTGESFKPAIKVFKHLRSRLGIDAVSFHIECLLYKLPDQLFLGGPADYIPALLGHVANTSADAWYRQVVKTPCDDRDIFIAEEWGAAKWRAFHEAVTRWARAARLASTATNRDDAIHIWQALLGEDFFPTEVAP